MQKTFHLVLITLILLSNQNCTKISSFETKNPVTNTKIFGIGGDTFDGKPKDFYRVDPGFTCDNKPEANAEIHRSEKGIFSQSVRFSKSCEAGVGLPIRIEDTGKSPINPDYIGVNELIYSSEINPKSGEYAESWCQSENTNLESRFDLVIRNKDNLLKGKFYLPKDLQNEVALKSDFIVTRQYSSVQVKYDSNAFSLKIDRKVHGDQPWNYQGLLTRNIDGNDKTYPLNCRINLPGKNYCDGDKSLGFFPKSFAPFAGGSGTETDPFLICTDRQFNEIALNEANWSKHFKLMTEIQLYNWTRSGLVLQKIGSNSVPFSGSLDGQGFAIHSFKYDGGVGENDVGIFSHIRGASIRNLLVTYAQVRGGNRTGILASKVFDSKVDNVHLRWTYIHRGSGGGLAAEVHNSTVTNSSFEVTSTGMGDVSGGLAGLFENSRVEFSESSGGLNASLNTGGLVGISNDSHFYATRSTEAVFCGGIGLSAGGLVGVLKGASTIRESYSVGKLDCGYGGTNGVGGLVGKLDAVPKDFGVFNSYSLSSVMGIKDYGGLIGFVDQGSPRIESSFSFGAVVSSHGSTGGGSVGLDRSTSVSNTNNGAYGGVFWNRSASPNLQGFGKDPQNQAVIGLEEVDFSSPSQFQSAGWSPQIWFLSEGMKYPRLNWEP